MSEFLAEARILVRPDTTRFRAELEASIAAATKKPVVIPVVAQVSTGRATTRGLDTALKEQQVALDAVGAAQTRAVVTTTRLASAQNAADAAAKKLALSQEAVQGASSSLAASQITLSRSTAAVAASEAAVAKAVAAGDKQLIAATRDTLALAEAQEALALTALSAARAEAAQARTLGAIGKASGAAAAGMAGLRGQVLTAGTAFLAATVAIQAVSKSIGTASDTTEELNKTFEVFGSSSKQIQEFAQTSASSLGIANVEALRAASTFGNLFRAIDISGPAAAEMSENLVRLAADLASFNNADPTLVLQNLRSGLAGEAEPLHKFGIFLSEARVQQEALIESGKENVKQLTQAEKVQARFNIILQDSAIAQGDFERTSADLANQQRILKAELTDLGGDLGNLLIPFLTQAATGASNLARALGDISDISKSVARPIADFGNETGKASGFVDDLRVNIARILSPGAQFAATTGTIADFLDKLAGSADTAEGKVTDLAHSFPAAGRAAHEAAQGINELKDVLTQLSGLEVDRLQIQTGLEPGGAGAEQDNLRAQIEADKRAVEEAQSGSAARRQALQDLKSDQEELLRLQNEQAALQEQQAAEAEKNANEVKARAEEALRAQQAADAALIDLLGRRRDDAERRADAAATTAGLQDDIRAQNQIQALIKVQIAKIRDQVKDEQQRRDAIRELRIALIASRAEEDKLRAERQAAAASRKDEIQNLNIEIAQERGNKAAIERAINARITTLNKQIKAAKGDVVKVKQLILERERLKNELEELNKQQDEATKQGKTAAQKQFEFLQSLQGFSANLLGNLIPGFATAGLVGGSQPPAAGQPFDVGAQVQQGAALQASEVRGVRPVQVDRTNQILEQILAALTGKTTPPEITNNRRSGSAMFDTL